ncbi:MAG TPA: hypothetical protein VG994_07980, partial [Steroidobacteraceae bacterium]|nr:hypothetical protein [Steroidobacteraceae bacterium]
TMDDQASGLPRQRRAPLALSVVTQVLKVDAAAFTFPIAVACGLGTGGAADLLGTHRWGLRRARRRLGRRLDERSVSARLARILHGAAFCQNSLVGTRKLWKNNAE